MWAAKEHITKAGKNCFILVDEAGKIARTRHGAYITYEDKVFAEEMAVSRSTKAQHG